MTVVKPLAETRPAWKVLRVLGNLANLTGFDFESSNAVLAELGLQELDGVLQVPSERLGNVSTSAITVERVAGTPCTAGIYQLDGLVRRATSLQMTADARGLVASGVTA